MTGRTKIVATIGPASDSPDMLAALIDAGVDVVRLNLSHGRLEDHLERLGRIRAVATERRRPVAVLADLPGPKIRAGTFPDGGVRLLAGSTVELRPGNGVSDASTISVPYPTLVEDLNVGSRVQLGDGAISLGVIEVHDGFVTARIETGGEANGRPGVHLSSETLRLPSPTPEDLVLAEAVAAAGVEYIAVSFVRAARRPGRGPCRRRRPCATRREDRDQGGDRSSARDRGCVRCGHGRSGGPRHRLPDRGRSPPPEAHPASLRRSRGAGDHRDADARVHDHRAVSHTRRGERRGQRSLRRDRCGDAVRRDGDRARSGGGRAHDGTSSPSGPRRRPRTVTGPIGSVGSSARRRITTWSPST